MKHKLALICAVAVALRVLMALYMGNHVAELPGIHDQISYDALAQRVVAGYGFSFEEPWYPFTPADTPTAHWSFLYTLYLAAIYRLAGYQPLMARLIQAVLAGVLMPGLIYRLGNRVAGPTVGLLAAAISAIYAYFVYYAAALMTETFYMILVLLALDLAMTLAVQPDLGRWAIFGAVLAAIVLLRQVFAPVGLLIVGWILWRGHLWHRWWLALIPLGIIVVAVMPWTIRNYSVYHAFLPLNSNAGYALYASLHPSHGTDWQPPHAVVPIPADWLQQYNEAQLDRLLTRAGLGYVLDDPVRILLLSIDKTLDLFKFWPSADSSLPSNLARTASFGLMLPFIVWGLYLSHYYGRTYGLLYLFMALYSLIHMISWPAPRYRLPVDTCLTIFAALAIDELIRAWRRRHRLETGFAAHSAMWRHD